MRWGSCVNPSDWCTVPSVAVRKTTRLNPTNWTHVRGKGDVRAGVVYKGEHPFAYKSTKGETVTVNPGERVSRRQYENLRYQAAGWTSKAQYERIAKAPGRVKKGPHQLNAYKRWGKIYAEENNTTFPKGPFNPYAEAFARAMNTGFSDTGPDSDFAQLLVAVGLRTDHDTWDVGDTPSSK